MNAVDTARRALQLAASEFLNHLKRDNCGAACRHAQAKKYAEARAKCERLEREQLQAWLDPGRSADPLEQSARFQ